MEQPERPALVILIVEDHLPTLMAVQALVAAAIPGCRTLGAESGEQALKLCAAEAPHLVVMDIVLPGMDGIEATRRIRTLLPDTRVVMHSSHDLQIYREGSAAAGAGAFVTKNRTFTDLVPAITGLLPPGFTVSGGGGKTVESQKRKPQSSQRTTWRVRPKNGSDFSSLCVLRALCG